MQENHLTGITGCRCFNWASCAHLHSQISLLEGAIARATGFGQLSVNIRNEMLCMHPVLTGWDILVGVTFLFDSTLKESPDRCNCRLIPARRNWMKKRGMRTGKLSFSPSLFLSLSLSLSTSNRRINYYFSHLFSSNHLDRLPAVTQVSGKQIKNSRDFVVSLPSPGYQCG